jgi:Na+-transporting NADH:ubiquinone oxidoreductase subunit F
MSILNEILWNNVVAASLIFLVIVLVLTIILLLAKSWLVNSGEVAISINEGSKLLHSPAGKSLLATLNDNGVHLSSACGGKGSCGQCKLQVVSGGGDILPTEAVHFSRKQIKDHWRLGCQVKVKSDLEVKVDPAALDVKEWECEVISNKNVATFIKEFIVQLPAGEHMNFIPGSYAQIRIPKYEMDYDKDIDKSLIGDEYLPAWEKFGLFTLKAKNEEDTVRAYSMANYPEEGDRFMLTVRIATPPFKPKPQTGFQNVPAGIASSYIFSLKPGDKVMMSGPYGDFHPIVDSKAEMIWVGGGAGMAPLRAQIMWMTKTLRTTDRVMHYFYGARALNEVFYLEDFLQLEKEFPNFHFHLALDRPDPAADAAGVKYTAGFVHDVMFKTYLKDHEAPEDIQYYMCGPGPMSNAVNNMLYNLGVEPESIHYDNFGG